MNSVVASLKSFVRALISQGKKVSVWGAGHRALALMAISNLDEIDYVIDSASFKQGKYTPILKKKIVSPEQFFSSLSCDCLIVMLPGALSDQVSQYLKSKDFRGKTVYFNDNRIESEIC